MKFKVDLNDNINISLTGGDCYLSCWHCRKYYLKSMRDISFLSKVDNVSCLISGGVNEKLFVDFTEHKKFLYEIKKKNNLKYNFHPGFITKKLLEFDYSMFDILSIDLPLSKKWFDLTNGFYKVNFDEVLNIAEILMSKYKVAFHFTFGLFNLEEELEKALFYLERLDLNYVIINFNTGKFVRSIDWEEAVNVVEKIKKIFKDLNIIIGCMRPYARWRENFDSKVKDKVLAIVKTKEKANNFSKCCAFLMLEGGKSDSKVNQ